MTPRVAQLREMIVNKKHFVHRREFNQDLAEKFAKQKLEPIARVSFRTKLLLQSENPIFLDDERISFLRTFTKLPPLFSTDEWDAIKCKHFIHELGSVCNISPDYESTIAVGLDERKKEAVLCLDEAKQNDDKEGVLFLDSLISQIDAVLDLSNRYRQKALRLGKTEIAEVLAQVPRFRPRSFLEALQFFRILHFTLWYEGEYHNTVGRFDQYMWPYLQEDLRSGKLDKDSALDILEEFFLSFNRDSDLYPGVQQGDNGQSLVLGGLQKDGSYSFNLLSELCLEASRNLNLIDPKINLRVNSETPSRVFQLGTELTKKGLGFPQYSNDDVVIPGLMDLGYSQEDARDYVVAACWEFIIPGKGMDIPNIAAVSFPEIVLRCVNKHLKFSATFRDFMRSVNDEISSVCLSINNNINKLWMVPAPFMSMLMEGCVTRRRDVSLGLKYNNFGFHGTGISTAVDSLAAIQKYVFEEKTLTPDELIAALECDFDGWSELLAKLRFEAPKLGNADPATDALASDLLDLFADATLNLRNERGGRIRPGTGSAMYYIWHAKELGATPDGRRKGEWFGANYAPSLFARVGPLSVIQSFTKPNLRRIINGGPLTMEFHSSLFDQRESQEKVADFVQLFIEQGGHQMQLNAINREELLAAQRNPEQYGNLIVRIWGWSAYFVELDLEYQNHVIKRQEYAA